MWHYADIKERFMIDFIVHDKAGKGRAFKAKNEIIKRLTALKIPHRFHVTEHRGHGTEIAKDLCLSGADKIVAVGGDGTIHEVLNGLCNFESISFGIIPAGTGNDFATATGIPKKATDALELILSNNTRFTDFFECSGVRGINAIGTGIDVDILYRYEKSKRKTKLTYYLSLLYCLMHYKPYDLTFVDESGVKHAKKAFIACACNGRQFGGGIKICPQGVANDGLLDFILVNDIPKWKIPPALIKLVAGKIHTHKASEYSRVENVKVEGKFPVQIDGEIYENLPFDVKIIKNTLKIFAPTV